MSTLLPLPLQSTSATPSHPLPPPALPIAVAPGTTTSSTPDTAPPSGTKLAGHDWWESIGRPKYVVAPMVDQSELAWRILSRVHGATLAYTPMFHAALFSSSDKYFAEMFDTSPGSLEGVAPFDRPLVVQFCANDKDLWLKAAEKVVGRCDAVDLNLGCPQGIAKKGHYGAFLMEEWDLIRGMISHLHAILPLPIIAKLRVFPSLSRTLSYASHVLSSGAQLLTIHGRTREAKGQLAGFASWSHIRAVVQELGGRVPVLANGGVPGAEEVGPCLDETGASGVMSAEGNLYNPMIFSPENAKGGREYVQCLPVEMREALLRCEEELIGEWDKDRAAYAPATFLAAQYLAIVRTLPGTKTSTSAIKAHLFKLFRPVWATGRHHDVREMLGTGGVGKRSYEERVEEYGKVVEEMRRRIKADLLEGLLPANSHRPLTHAEVLADFGGVIPYSHAQPYFRVVAEAVADVEESKEKRARPVEDMLPEADRTITSVVSDSPPGKRARLEVATDLSAASSARDLDTPPPKILPCAGTTAASTPCPNESALRCPHTACSGCCALFQAAIPSAEALCEHHTERARKDRERAENKRANMKARRKVAQEGKMRRKVEMEVKAKEREEAKAKAKGNAKAGGGIEGGLELNARAGAEETLRIETGRTEVVP